MYGCTCALTQNFNFYIKYDQSERTI
jgi:hypothetical protein